MGHALPMVSIGRTMAQRGHQVIFAVSEGGNGAFRVVDSDDGLPLSDCHWISMILRDQNCSCRDVEANWMIFREKSITAKRWDFGIFASLWYFVLTCF